MNATANLGKAPVRTLVLQLAIPSMTAQFVNVLYSIIDRMYIGHISENGALALAGDCISANKKSQSVASCFCFCFRISAGL